MSGWKVNKPLLFVSYFMSKWEKNGTNWIKTGDEKNKRFALGFEKRKIMKGRGGNRKIEKKSERMKEREK